MAKRISYAEPAEFFPKSVRKELGLGEYANKESKKPAAKPAAKKPAKAKKK